MNAITAKIGADIAPLKKSLPEGEALLKASSKRAADDAKKAAAEASKAAAAQKASSDALKSGAKNATKELVNAGSAADVAAIGVSHVAENLKLGLVGGIAVAALSAIIGKVDEAVEKTKQFRDTLASAFRARGGSGGYGIGDIQAQLSQTAEAGAALKDREANPLKTKFSDKIANTWNAITSTMGLTDRNADEGDDSRREKVAKQAQGDIERLTQKTKDLAAIEQIRITSGEKAAELAKIEMERSEKTGAALRMAQEFRDKTGLAVDTNGLQKQTNAEAATKASEAERKAMEAQREIADQVQDGFARADASEKSLTDRAGALADEIERMGNLEKEMVSRGDELAENDERRHAFAAKANQFATQKKELLTQQKALERELENTRTDSANAQTQSAINVTALTNKGLAQKQQLALIEKQLADLAERRMRAEEGAKPAIDAQAAALRAQAAQVQNERNQLSPVQRARRERAERAELRRLNHNARANAAVDRDRDHAARAHADNVKPWNIAHPAVIVKPDTEVKRALDEMKAELRTWNQRPARIA